MKRIERKCGGYDANWLPIWNGKRTCDCTNCPDSVYSRRSLHDMVEFYWRFAWTEYLLHESGATYHEVACARNRGSLPNTRRVARTLSYWMVPLFILGGYLADGIILLVYPSSGADIRIRYWPGVLFPIATLLVVYNTTRICLRLRERKEARIK